MPDLLHQTRSIPILLRDAQIVFLDILTTSLNGREKNSRCMTSHQRYTLQPWQSVRLLLPFLLTKYWQQARNHHTKPTSLCSIIKRNYGLHIMIITLGHHRHLYLQRFGGGTTWSDSVRSHRLRKVPTWTSRSLDLLIVTLSVSGLATGTDSDGIHRQPSRNLGTAFSCYKY